MTLISSFNPESPPYLFSTECPWIFWPEEVEIEGKRVFTVAGSGDVPLYFLYRSAAEVIAFDVSEHACMWNKLKPLFMKGIGFRDLRNLFKDLIDKGDTEPLWNLIRNNYPRLRPGLEKNARKYWDELILSPQASNPLKNWLRPTDTLFVPLLFYLEEEKTFNFLKRKIKPYRIFKGSIEMASEIIDGTADILYCSNVCEYLRVEGEGLAITFLNNLGKSLSSDGVIICYETQKASRATAAYKHPGLNYRILKVLEGVLKPRKGFCFNHSMVVMSKAV
ncbi:hypothetical protein [Thermodesulforhabdus norvegica]|uniref:DUF3419 family protein n=1 Tax=Thermodesulforhabdus norvegica TaxID=39841 RepID=A0A1I4RL70_9BACT|nr:hypothetical protein [Thermodesulforhabdus norvegica]SFM52964.1 hypothetical protein SAMN05660836_00678 [Thermodesulforhabdus norvegica]